MFGKRFMIFFTMFISSAVITLLGSTLPAYAATTSVSKIVLSKNIDTLTKGSSDTLIPVILPTDATDKNVVWSSSNTAVATVNAGNVTAVAPGTAVISAATEDGNKKDVCTVTVPAPVTGVSLDNTSSSTINIGDSINLTPVIAPANAANKNVTWQSDHPEIATVDEKGRIVGISGGTAIITVNTVDGSFTAAYSVTVQTGVSQISLSGATPTLAVGSNETLTATVSPGNATNQGVTWKSANPAVATVDASGKVTAVAPGSTTISVTTKDGNKTAIFTVNVTLPVTGISIKQPGATINVGSSVSLTTVLTPANTTDKGVIWSTNNPAIASVDQYGRVVGIGNGTATITVTSAVSSSLSATCSVTVQTGVNQVVLSKSTDTLSIGNTDSLSATIVPSGAANQNVTWKTSNAAVVSVDQSGKITALKSGSAVISVTTQDGNKTSSCVVTVPTVVTGISFNKTSTTINIGSTTLFTPIISPSSATNKVVTWSSNNLTVVSVDQNGNVKGVGVGEADITATTQDGSKTGTVHVIVQIGVSKVTLNEVSIAMQVGKSFSLQEAITPTNATNQAVTWKSSNNAYATVDANGKVTALKAGTVTISVTTLDGNKTASCRVAITN